MPERPVFHVQERHQVEAFREDLKKKVLEELGPTFPELQIVLNGREENTNTLPYEHLVFRLLDSEKKMLRLTVGPQSYSLPTLQPAILGAT